MASSTIGLELKLRKLREDVEKYWIEVEEQLRRLVAEKYGSTPETSGLTVIEAIDILSPKPIYEGLAKAAKDGWTDFLMFRDGAGMETEKMEELLKSGKGVSQALSQMKEK